MFRETRKDHCGNILEARNLAAEFRHCDFPNGE